MLGGIKGKGEEGVTRKVKKKRGTRAFSLGPMMCCGFVKDTIALGILRCQMESECILHEYIATAASPAHAETNVQKRESATGPKDVKVQKSLSL